MIKKLLFVCALLLTVTAVSAQRRNNFGGSYQGRNNARNDFELPRDYNRSQSAYSPFTYDRGSEFNASTSEVYQSPGVFVGGGGDVRLWLGGHLQADGGVFFGATDDIPKIGNNVILRRLRASARVEFGRNWGAMFEGELDNSRLVLRNVYASYNNGAFRVRGGNFKEDFGMGIVTSATNQWVMEQPMVLQALAPGYHLGIDARFRHKWIYASVGGFFQVIDNGTAVVRAEQASLSGRNQGFSGTARLVFNPFWNAGDWGVHIGGAASYRTPKTDADDSSAGGFHYSATNSTAINRRRYLDTGGHPGITKYELLTGGEAAAHWRGLRLQGEYVLATNTLRKDRPMGYPSQYTFNGFYAQVSYMLFGGQQRYNMANGVFAAPSLGRSWGDIEVVGRYDYLDLIDRDIVGGDGQNFTFGVNFYPNDNLRFMLNYQYSDNSGIAAYPKGARFQMAGLRMEVIF